MTNERIAVERDWFNLESINGEPSTYVVFGRHAWWATDCGIFFAPVLLNRTIDWTQVGEYRSTPGDAILPPTVHAAIENLWKFHSNLIEHFGEEL